MRCIHRWDEQGILLTEMAVSMPVIILLLTLLASLLAWSWRSYEHQVADAELRQELQMTLARVTDSALRSDHIQRGWRDTYAMRQDVLRPGIYHDRYRLHEGRVVLNYTTQPMTGAFSGAGVHISDFRIEEDAALPHLYHIHLTGESVVTGHIHTLSTAVYLWSNDNAHTKTGR